MPRAVRIGQKYFVSGSQGELESISPEDLVARSGSTYQSIPTQQALQLFEQIGDIQSFDPSQLKLTTAPSGQSLINIGTDPRSRFRLEEPTGQSGLRVPAGSTLEQIVQGQGLPVTKETGKASEAQLVQERARLTQAGVQPQIGQQVSPTGQILPSGGTSASSSIVDYLKSTGQPSDFASRTQLAAKYGIQGYKGTAQQNTQLLGAIRGQGVNSTVTPSPDTGIKVIGQTPVQQTDQQTQQDPLIVAAESIAQKYGLTLGDSSQNPHTTYTDYYSKVYSDLSLDKVKTFIDNDIKSYTDLQNELNDKLANINESPWLSQGIRDARSSALETRYEGKISILTNRIKLNQSIYESGRSDAQHAADKMIEASHQGQQLNQDLAFKLIDLKEKEVAAANAQLNQGDIKEYELAVRQGYTGKFIDFLGAKKQATTINVGSGGLTPEAQSLLAQSYLATGVLPSLGLGAQGLRAGIFNKAADYAQQLGLTGPEVVTGQAGFQANKTALAQLTKQKNIILAFEKTANANLKIAESLSDKVGRTGSPVINRWLLAGKRSIAGDVDVAKFDAAVRTSINEYARVVSTVTGGGVTSDQARKEVESLLNTAQTKQQVIGVIQTLQQEMENRRIGYEQQEQSIKSNLRSPFGGTSQAGFSGTTNSGLNYQILP